MMQKPKGIGSTLPSIRGRESGYKVTIEESIINGDAEDAIRENAEKEWVWRAKTLRQFSVSCLEVILVVTAMEVS